METLDIYCVSEESFIKTIDMLSDNGKYEGWHTLGLLWRKKYRYRPREQENTTVVLDILSAMGELTEFASITTDEAFAWAVIAVDYEVSPEIIADVIKDGYSAFLISDRFRKNPPALALSILYNDIDASIIDSLVHQ